MHCKNLFTFYCLVYTNFLLTISASGEPTLSRTGNNEAVPPPPSYPPGDVRRCQASLGKNVQRFEVLPGGGWDNLQNRDMGMVSFLNYSLCKTTDDGKFLIPDNVITVPVKSSRVETFAEMFEHWTNYTSVTSRGINVHAGLNLAHFGISGSFSKEYRHVKSKQFYDKSVTTRIQVRYVRYEARLQPDTPYLAVFRDRLRKIAAHITLNRTSLAKYESQLLVRDFGTHLITSLDVGAALVQLDQVRAEYVRKYDSDTSTIKASASASFFSVFDFGASYSQSTSKTMIDEYKKSRTSSHVDTIGGPVYKPLNYTANTWTDSIDSNMVALDRFGDPIYFSINEQTLPDLPSYTVFQVNQQVKAAVEEYYKHNMYRGCTHQDSPNFDFQANVDDGTCKPPKTNYTFGGVYQTCSGYSTLCSSMTQKNPLTGDYSCSPGYEAILLQTDTKSVPASRRVCHGCWLLFHCCHQESYMQTAHYSAYWCAAKGVVKQNHGFLFGGLYNPMVDNPLTMSKSCPPQFYKLKLLGNLVVCVSDDYELGYRYSLPFAGFFSCHSGNPLALRQNNTLKSGGVGTLNTFMLESGPTSYPRECPEGYSQHLAVIDATCEINYCVKYGSLTPQGLPNVQRPPFMEAPVTGYSTLGFDGDTFVFNDEGTVWMSMEEAQENFSVAPDTSKSGQSEGSSSSRDGGLSAGGVAAISVVATLVCVAITTYVVIRIKRRRSLYRERDQLADRHVSQHRGYGGQDYTNMGGP